ncbi:unnamed protein product [Clonostachys rosea]|uniref:Uncharacterized protein n=1 Tax=Bionectria ochroleuca TaxID=29856 RepID=A0ABY6UCG6_BIOOC|nr:unnamed protein product [Clonostachys rosea]
MVELEFGKSNRQMDQAHTGIDHEQTAIFIENQAAGPGEAIGDQAERPVVCHDGRGIVKGQNIGAVSSEDRTEQSCHNKKRQCALHHGARLSAQLLVSRHRLYQDSDLEDGNVCRGK